MSKTDELLSTAQVAELAQVKPRTVARWVAEGLPTAHKLPGETGAYLFTRADVDAFLAARVAS